MLRIKKFVLSHLAVATHEVAVLAPQIRKLRDHFILARFELSACRGVAVSLRVFSKKLEATVTMTRAAGSGGIDFVEIAQDGIDGCVHAVKIQAEHADTFALSLALLIPIAQPFDELDHDCVTPHPRGKPAEIAQRFRRVALFGSASDITMYAQHVGPIGFQCDDPEIFLRNQATSELRAPGVELVGSMRRFANEHKSRGTSELDQIVVIGGCRNTMRRIRDRRCHVAARNSGAHDCVFSVAARASNSRTSSSLVCEKSS